MAWGLSHTAEAYQYAAERIAELTRRKLQDAAIGWKAALREYAAEQGEPAPRFTFDVRKLPRDILVDFVVEHALGEHGSCSNGGWELYVDPEGWITVPFGPEDTAE